MRDCLVIKVAKDGHDHVGGTDPALGELHALGARQRPDRLLLTQRVEPIGMGPEQGAAEEAAPHIEDLIVSSLEQLRHEVPLDGDFALWKRRRGHRLVDEGQPFVRVL